jgi:hypothetical protein
MVAMTNIQAMLGNRKFIYKVELCRVPSLTEKAYFITDQIE